MESTTRVVKSILRRGLARFCDVSHIALSCLQGKLLILTYHRVFPEEVRRPAFVQPGMYVTSDVFEKQMAFLKEHFCILTFPELMEHWERKDWDPKRRYCIVTFDDGWLDNYLHAYPILKKWSIPATLFLPTGFIGTDQWFWPERIGFLLESLFTREKKDKEERVASLGERYDWIGEVGGGPVAEQIDRAIGRCKEGSETEIEGLIDRLQAALGISFPQERVIMNWNEVEEMSRNQIAFGSHSVTHRILTQLPEAEIRIELERSLQDLRRNGVNRVAVFCYPNGNYSRTMSNLLEKTGYEAAVSTRFGFGSFHPEERYEMRRINIHNEISKTTALFAFHLCGFNHGVKFSS